MSERGRGTPAVEHAREIIVRALAKTAADGLALLPIRHRDEGDFIGYCGLAIGCSTVEEPEIAYELLRHVHGRGYATEAARAVLDAAIATGRKRLWSTVRLTSRLYGSSGTSGSRMDDHTHRGPRVAGIGAPPSAQ
jgi:RimJ/RimL family protein N-acetyltransferase